LADTSLANNSCYTALFLFSQLKIWQECFGKPTLICQICQNFVSYSIAAWYALDLFLENCLLSKKHFWLHKTICSPQTVHCTINSRCLNISNKVHKHLINPAWKHGREVTNNKSVPSNVVIQLLQWYSSSNPISTILHKHNDNNYKILQDFGFITTVLEYLYLTLSYRELVQCLILLWLYRLWP